MQPLLAVLTHNVVSLYAEPDRGSERVSQALWGDVAEMLEGNDRWVRIRTRDDYSGWVTRKHLRPVAPDEPYASPDWPYDDPKALRVATPSTVPVFERSPHIDPLVNRVAFGTLARIRGRFGKVGYRHIRLPQGTEQHDGTCSVFIHSNDITCLSRAPFSPAHAANVARWFLGVPYLWGGSSPFGFDCSGFVQAVYRYVEITLPRDAYLQAECSLGTRLPPEACLQAADLVFFGGTPSARGHTITHVGMALGKKKIIHASGRDGVCMNTMDEMAVDHGYRTICVWRYGQNRSRASREAAKSAKETQ